MATSEMKEIATRETCILQNAGGILQNAIDVILNPDNSFIIKEGQGAILIV